jgi:glycosyltransferase involved in cell wall biosynthesis
MKLSICVPTYNRPQYLENCLNSILIAKKKEKCNFNFEVCVSDNGSKHDIKKIINKYKKNLNVKFHRFGRNMGISVNFLKTIKMASGEFIWMLGSDDMLVPNAFKELNKIYKKNKDVDFVCINSFNLKKSYLDKFSHPFNTLNLPNKMDSFSKLKISRKLDFWQLIDPKIAWDFMLAMFLLMFKREMFCKNLNAFDYKKIKDKRWMSNQDNTFFYLKVFANAFKNSKAFFCAKPLSVNMQGVREWTTLYYLVEIIRIPEILDYYRSQGLGFFRYIYCKNFSLRNFTNYVIKILLSGKKGRSHYIDVRKHIFSNLIFPNVYLSIIYFFIRKIKQILNLNEKYKTV